LCSATYITAVDLPILEQALVEERSMAKKASVKAEKIEAPVFDRAEDMIETARTRWSAVQGLRAETGEALSVAGKTAFEGFVAFNTQVLDFTQALVNDRIATLKSALEAKSVKDVVAAETAFARRTYASTVSHVQTLGGIARQSATETMKPVSKVVSDVMGKKAA
jgi:hypothetical protein